MPAHLDFLDNNKTQIETAGPLYDKTNTTTGGLWIVDAADEIAVERLVETDPLWATGLRRSFAVRRWTQVFANGKATGLP